MFNAQRMVRDYVTRYYAAASTRAATFSKKNYAAAQQLADWRKEITAHWGSVYLSASALNDTTRRVGDTVELAAILHPNDLANTDIRVEVVYGPEDDALEHNLHTVEMQLLKTNADGSRQYTASFKPELSGQLSYGVRAYPVSESLVSPFDGHAVSWA